MRSKASERDSAVVRLTVDRRQEAPAPEVVLQPDPEPDSEPEIIEDLEPELFVSDSVAETPPAAIVGARTTPIPAGRSSKRWIVLGAIAAGAAVLGALLLMAQAG